MNMRTTIVGVALCSAFFGASAQAQEIFQPGTVPTGDLLAPPVSSVIQSAATPMLDATAFTSRNTTITPSIDQGFTVLSPEDAALLAAQAVGEPVTIGGFGQTISTAPTGLTAFPTAAPVATATPSPLLTTPAGVDTGLTAVAIVNGVPVTSGPVTNIRSGYGNAGATITNSFGGSVLVSYGSDLPIVGPDYAGQLPGSGLSNPSPIPYVDADRAESIAAAARSGTDSVANSAALSGRFPLATNYTGPLPAIRPAAGAYRNVPNTVASSGTTRSTSQVLNPFPTDQDGTADAAGENVTSPVNESKDAVQSFSRITESEATAEATAPATAATGDGTGLVSRSNRDLAAAAAEPSTTTVAAGTGSSNSGFVSSNRTLTGTATTVDSNGAVSTPTVAAGSGGCDATGITLQFEGTSNRFTGAQTNQVKEFGELCAAAKQGVLIVGYADSSIANENDALRIVKGRVLRALHALTDAGLDDTMVTRETLVPTGNQPSNALIIRAN